MTNYFPKAKSLFSTTLSTSISTGTSETITLASVVGLPTDTEFTITIDRVASDGVTKTPTKMERIRGTISGSNLINYTRGVEGTEQAHSAGAIIEYVFNAADWNDHVDGILVGHEQTGVHKTFTSQKFATSLNDTNGNELMKVTATSSAVNEITLANAATNNNPILSATGGDNNVGIDFKTKGTGVIRIPCSITLYVVDAVSSLSTGDGKLYFTIPEELNGMNLIRVHARVITAGTTNTTDIQIANVTDSVDMLSTKLTIDSTETGSDTAATPAVIDTTKDDVATNDLLRIDIDAVSTTAPKGLIVRLAFALP